VRAGLLAALLAALPAWACAGEVLDRIRAHGQLVVAYRGDAVPFSYVVEGQPVGYAIDLCRKIVAAVQSSLGLPNLEIRFLPVSVADRIHVVVDGRADLECGSTTSTAKRRSEVEFTVPHFVGGTRIAVRADSQLDVLSKFQSRKLVSVRGTTGLAAIRRLNAERGLNITVVEASNHADALSLVAAGSVDGFVMDDVLLRGAIVAQGMSQRIKVIGPYLTVEPLSVVLGKSDREFKAIVDAEMKRIVREGEIRRIYDRWFKEPIPPLGVSLQIPPGPLLQANWRHPSDFVPE
jgi:glutamate/aspartate transport system substrate-binding protein